MSIAVSAVIQPSRMLRILVCGMYLGAAGLAALLVWENTTEHSLVLRLVFPLPGFLITFAGISRAIRNEKALHIDISGNGQIKVDEDDASGRGVAGKRHGAAARLLPNSTIWPFLLLLRLQTEDRTIRNWVILPDSTSAESFRALSVAARWIAAHNNRAERKIL